VVEPGFFRTDLLDAQNVRWVSKVIEDYAPEDTAEDMWSPYNGTQPNDPAKLGDPLVKIAAMPNPPKVSIAGSDRGRGKREAQLALMKVGASRKVASRYTPPPATVINTIIHLE
jgi:hypothetical protein